MCRSIITVNLGVFAVCLASAAFAEPTPKGATISAAETTPEDIIRHLYADYMSGSKELKDSAEEKIRPYASRALQRAIDTEIHCEKKSGEECAIDSDYIVAGQDWGKISDFHIDRSATPNGLTLRARFREKGIEPDHQVVTYSFVREGDAWRIDDVDDGGAGASLKKTIASYFEQYDENNNPRKKGK